MPTYYAATLACWLLLLLLQLFPDTLLRRCAHAARTAPRHYAGDEDVHHTPAPRFQDPRQVLSPDVFCARAGASADAATFCRRKPMRSAGNAQAQVIPTAHYHAQRRQKMRRCGPERAPVSVMTVILAHAVTSTHAAFAQSFTTTARPQQSASPPRVPASPSSCFCLLRLILVCYCRHIFFFD